MASPLVFKVYGKDAKTYLAATRHAEDAAAIVALHNGVIKRNGVIVWDDRGVTTNADGDWISTTEECPAAESYDVVAHTINRRWLDNNLRSAVNAYGPKRDDWPEIVRDQYDVAKSRGLV